jgi:hypothetical protein
MKLLSKPEEMSFIEYQRAMVRNFEGEITWEKYV